MDVREAILARLVAVAGTIPGVVTVARNRDLLDDEELPAVQIIDGDELADPADPRVRPAPAPRQVTMTPIIDLRASANAEEIGARLNGLRAALIKAVMTDAALAALCRDGIIRYDGCRTALVPGRQVEGECALTIAFVYALKPTEL